MPDDDELLADLERIMMQLELQARTYRAMAVELPRDRDRDAQRALGHADGLLDARNRLRELLAARRR